jgi:arginase family enzyme
VYVSIDLDGLDPAFAPGVSHHEPGGLSSRELINLIHHMDAQVVGGDIVEFNPDRDINDITATVSAKLLKELIGKIIK